MIVTAGLWKQWDHSNRRTEWGTRRGVGIASCNSSELYIGSPVPMAHLSIWTPSSFRNCLSICSYRSYSSIPLLPISVLMISIVNIVSCSELAVKDAMTAAPRTLE